LLRSERDGIAGTCPTCAAPHSRGAPFCWQCGGQLMESAGSAAVVFAGDSREGGGGRAGSVGESAADGDAPTRRLPVVSAPADGTPADGAQSAPGGIVASPTQPPAANSPSGIASALPSPRVSALLVLVFLAFGTILGGAAGSNVNDTLAASGSPERIVLPSTAASPTETTPTPPPSSGSADTEAPPPLEAAATPANAPSTSAGAGGASKQAAGEESGAQGGEGSSGTSGSKKPTVKHVFVIMLADQPYAALFGPASKLTYLARKLEPKGELLARYYSVAHQELAGEIALLSGQGATPQTEADCPTYADISPASIGAEGQVSGEGCVYPASAETLLDQLRAKQLSWRAYIQGLEQPPSNLPACTHPTLGQSDPSSWAEATTPAAPGAAPPAAATSPYATFRDPFVYFHSLIDSPSCQALDVGLANLESDLANPRGAPAFSYISPDLCHDASPAGCPSGTPAGPGAADGFLEAVVPQILASASYKEGGLLVITADQAPAAGALADSSSCCGQPRFPDLPQSAVEEASANALAPPGGGQVGALLLSPYVKAGTVSQEPADTYSLLRLFEDLFGVRHLGYAASSRLTALEPSSLLSAPPG
ncbi:MAG TPA: alkaline phosphatase family protein, partial [Solirubrobacteraceae bacterium]|nr:alkaline phosphatase family protein [Solirubrobacteraceae bacterium]